MGISKLFGEESNFTSFSETTKLEFNDILHRTKIEVNPKFTDSEAASATVNGEIIDSTNFKNLRNAEDISERHIEYQMSQFHCNRPFTFIIFYNSQQILFTGVYRGPN